MPTRPAIHAAPLAASSSAAARPAAIPVPARATLHTAARAPRLAVAAHLATTARLAVAALALLASAAAPAHAQPAVKSAVAGFTDVNGNGLLDCGEPVDFLATFATRNSNTPPLTGQLIAGGSGVSGLIFQAGSVTIDPDLTNGCTGTIVLGNNPGDSDARVDFSCPADPPDNNAWTIVIHYQGRFAGSSPSFTAVAFAQTSDGATYNDAATGTAAGAVCGGGGVPTQIAVTKTGAGPATPASTLLYTITATDQSGAGAGGLQLVEAVPPHTTFSPAGSSPGWVCSPGPAAGSLCRNPVGNLNPNATLTAFFTVTLDPILPAAPVAIPNTACVRLGPDTVAGCASLTTPAAGTPTLHLAKTLAPGQTAAIPGATLTYALSAANTGNQDLAGAVLQETVPAFTSFSPGASSPGWTCAPAAGPPGAACTLDLGPLPAAAPAAARTFAVVVADPLPPLSPTYVFANTACLHTPTSGAAGVPDSCSTVGVPSAGTPMLQAAKTLRSGNGTPGTVQVYDLAVQNTGNEGAGAVDALETVPAHTTFAPAASAPGWTCVPPTGPAGAACTLSLGPLLAGATAHTTFALNVDRPLAAGVTAITNTACFRFANLNEAAKARQAAAKARPAAATNPACDTLTTPTLGHPALTLAKSYAGPPAAAGALLPFQLTAANAGDQDAAAVTLTETVPAHTTFAATASSPGWTCVPASGPAGATCTLPLGTMPAGVAGAPGPATTVTFAVRADSPLPAGVQQIANVACAAAPGLAPACGQTTTPPPVSSPALAAELQDAFAHDILGNGQAVAGDDLAYTLTVTNPAAAGAAPALTVVVTVPLDPRLTLDVGSVSTTAGTVTAGNAAADTVPTVQIPSLAPGATVTIRFTAAVGPLPIGLQFLSTQATLAASNVPPTVSDDPDTPEPLDPTTTPVGAARAEPIPTLDTWGLLLLCGALATVSLTRLTRRTGRRRPRPPAADLLTLVPQLVADATAPRRYTEPDGRQGLSEL